MDRHHNDQKKDKITNKALPSNTQKTKEWATQTSLKNQSVLSCYGRVTRRVPHLEQELSTLQEHPSSLPGFSGVRVARSLVFCGMFCRSWMVPSFVPNILNFVEGEQYLVEVEVIYAILYVTNVLMSTVSYKSWKKIYNNTRSLKNHRKGQNG